MLKKTLILITAILFSFSAQAQFREDLNIRREISPKFARIVVADKVTEEENLLLAPVSADMGHAMLSAMSGKYLRSVHMNRYENSNTLNLTGEVKGLVRYQFTRSLRNTFAAYTIINGKLNNKNIFETIQDLEGEEVSVNDIQLKNLQGENFLFHTKPESKRTFVEGNIGTQINLQVETFGDNSEQEAVDFVNSIKFDKLKSAVLSEQYTKTFADLEKEVLTRTKNHGYVRSLFEGE